MGIDLDSGKQRRQRVRRARPYGCIPSGSRATRPARGPSDRGRLVVQERIDVAAILYLGQCRDPGRESAGPSPGSCLTLIAGFMNSSLILEGCGSSRMVPPGDGVRAGINGNLTSGYPWRGSQASGSFPVVGILVETSPSEKDQERPGNGIEAEPSECYKCRRVITSFPRSTGTSTRDAFAMLYISLIVSTILLLIANWLARRSRNSTATIIGSSLAFVIVPFFLMCLLPAVALQGLFLCVAVLFCFITHRGYSQFLPLSCGATLVAYVLAGVLVFQSEREYAAPSRHLSL